MLSDIENLDIMLGENHFNTRERERERCESLNSNLARRPERVVSNDFENDDENTHVSPRVVNSGISADFDHNSATANTSAEINRLSSELNSRISREMDETMNSVSVQIQRAINDAISNQVLPQIQNAIKAGSGQRTKNGWDVPSERPEVNSESLRSEKARNDLKSEQTHGRQFNDYSDDRNAYDINPCIKYLGFYIDRNLTFQHEVKHLLRKKACGIKTLNAIKSPFNIKTRLLLMNALVLSHLHYSSVIINSISQSVLIIPYYYISTNEMSCQILF